MYLTRTFRLTCGGIACGLDEAGLLQISPASQEIVIDARQLQDRYVVWTVCAEALNREIEIEKKRALPVVAHHALNPEERRHARSSRDRSHVVQAARGIQDHVAGRELHRLHAERVFDHQLAAVIFGRIGEESVADRSVRS
jgi:hypothetical protein